MLFGRGLRFGDSLRTSRGYLSSEKEISMKRLHVHVGVRDLDQSIGFYSTLFGAAPTTVKPDYAKWMLDDPRVNFAISSGMQAAKGIEHLGIQAENEAELREVYGRLNAADRPVLEEGKTTCCYARSEKSWVADPDGVIWEAFHTTGGSTVRGGSPAFDSLAAAASPNAEPTKCCTPAVEAPAALDDAQCCDAGTPQGVCCDPKPHLAGDAPCCGSAAAA